MATKRLRVIAGPNGSGKSSVFPRIQAHVQTGLYLNPDELSLRFAREGEVDLGKFHLEPEADALRPYLHRQRSFVHKAELSGEPITLHLHGRYLRVASRERTGYTSALAAGFIREQLVASGQSFCSNRCCRTQPCWRRFGLRWCWKRMESHSTFTASPFPFGWRSI